jgi:hypothetical protein
VAGKYYLRTKRWLKRNFPLPFPCRVLLRPVEVMKRHKAHGIFYWHGDRAVIWIRNSGREEQMSETLIEEWVHGMRQGTPVKVDYEGEPHDAAFWALYGEVTTRWRKEVL